jgi:hypothetical protein
MKTMFVRPANGLTVRDPETRKALPVSGAAVPRSTYWQRRLACGDVVPARKRTARQDKGDNKK